MLLLTIAVEADNYEFNSTILNTNGTAGIQFDGVNYSMSNSSAVFNKTFVDLSGGTYLYYFYRGFSFSPKILLQYCPQAYTRATEVRRPPSDKGVLKNLQIFECRRRDSNPYSFRNTALNRARLPISPLRLIDYYQFP